MAVEDKREKRVHELTPILDLLSRMDRKIDDFLHYAEECTTKNNTLKAETYYAAMNAASCIHKSIKSAADEYANGLISLDEFKTRSKATLEDKTEHVQTLKTHRGWKEIVLNLLIALTGIGLIAIAGNSFHHGRFTLFTPSTDSGKTVDLLRNSVEHLQETAPVL
ncbi:hypothetical protein Lsha_2477 [Legionella shakespearei DSM 23087]|uniref:Ankyrin repeat protein n=2 Tax=Legionella shakespearei TaxID=45075 RepID=A0A0W0YLP1_9GAMM|nr:hypothetical protein Lsha_2477 [Legionella shakespearei DSM 23087]